MPIFDPVADPLTSTTHVDNSQSNTGSSDHAHNLGTIAPWSYQDALQSFQTSNPQEAESDTETDSSEELIPHTPYIRTNDANPDRDGSQELLPDLPSNEADIGDNVNLVDILPPIQLQEDIVVEQAELILQQLQENYDFHEDLHSTDEVHQVVEQLAEALTIQHCSANVAPDDSPSVRAHALTTIKGIAVSQFLNQLRELGAVATAVEENLQGHNWQWLPVMCALLTGALLAKLFIHYPPMELMQQSFYYLAQCVWRLVFHILDCVPGSSPPDDAQWQEDNPGTEHAVPMDVDDTTLFHDDSTDPEVEQHRLDLLTRCSEFTSSPKGRGKSSFPFVTGHLEPPSSDDAEPAPDNDVSDEGLAIKSTPPSKDKMEQPLGEPIIVWPIYGLEIPLSLYNDSDQVRNVLKYKMREAKSQQTGARLCTFSRIKKEVTYAEAYEDKSFRQWYLGRLHGPKSSLTPSQTEFATYCAEREELEWKFFQDFFPVGQQRTSQISQSPLQSQIEVLKKTRIRSVKETVPPKAEQASSSNEQPKQSSEPSRASTKGRFLLSNFKVGPWNFSTHLAMARTGEPSSNDEDSVCSFSVVDEQ